MTLGRVASAAVSGLLVTGAVHAIGQGPSPHPASVVLITLDTTRADRLSPYGGAVGVMPTLDAWASRGIVFDDATTLAPLTLPAHTSLLTGRTPPDHGVRDNAGALGDDVPTIASALHGAGYRTAAFVSSVVLGAHTGLARGFDVYRDVGVDGAPHRFRRPGSETTDEAVQWLDRNAGAPFFLWLHLYDAHAPIDLPEPFRTTYVNDPYDGALAFMDRQLARIANELEDRGVADSTAIVVAADHGEALGDHGERGHGIFVYQSVVHVPLVIAWPGVRPGHVRTPVELTDVMPTVLAIEGVARARVDGRPIAPFVRTADAPAREVYTESMYPRRFGWSDLRSLRAGALKVIDAPRPELYDLAVDPGEAHNLIGERRAEADALIRRLRALPGGAGGGALATASAETARALRSLGYLATPARSMPALLPDPKDMIADYNVLEAQRPRRPGANHRPDR